MRHALEASSSSTLSAKWAPTAKQSLVIAVLAVLDWTTLLVPWVGAGTTHRSAYSFARAFAATGMLSGAWERVFYNFLIALPILVALVCAASLFARLYAAVILATLQDAVLIAASVMALVKFDGRTEIGPWLGGVLGIASVVISGVLMRVKGQPDVRRI